MLLVVYGVAVVGDAIGHHQVAGLQHAVVAGDLVEDVLGDTDFRSFALGYEQGLGLAIVHDHVGAELGAVVVEDFLDSGESGRIAEILDEVLDEVLAHPFLGGELDVFAAYGVEDGDLVFDGLEVEVVLAGEVQIAHQGVGGWGVGDFGTVF